MITLPKELVDKFNDWLGREAVDTNRHTEYRKWFRYYLDFCLKYGHGYLDKRSLGLFTEKLKAKETTFLSDRGGVMCCSLVLSNGRRNGW
ncbi:hypothetical protein [Prosthecochloris aestuarii]|uniref:hypothetical protein n=1 Tax=Prosthecochloris aestuarii TaxID=1102 RepID=UPI00005408EB|nr:hypothetical protein [Prosthecochloris aestuarii]